MKIADRIILWVFQKINVFGRGIFTFFQDKKENIEEYIKYYNETRIVTKFKTNPIEYWVKMMARTNFKVK